MEDRGDLFGGPGASWTAPRMKLGELARVLGATLDGPDDIEITGVAGIEDAMPGTLTFLADRRHESHLGSTHAAAVLLAHGAPPAPLPALRVAHPYLSFVEAMELFYPADRPQAGVHPTAVIAATAAIGPQASLGPYVVI